MIFGRDKYQNGDSKMLLKKKIVQLKKHSELWKLKDRENDRVNTSGQEWRLIILNLLVER